MVDAAFGEVMVTCEKISWLIREGERYLKPEKRSPGVMVSYWRGYLMEQCELLDGTFTDGAMRTKFALA